MVLWEEGKWYLKSCDFVLSEPQLLQIYERIQTFDLLSEMVVR